MLQSAVQNMATNAGRTMLPLHSLLNPTSPGVPVSEPQTVTPTRSSSQFLSFKRPPRPLAAGSFAPKGRSSRTVNKMAKANPQGPINFVPFEDVDSASFKELSRFRVSPFGQIQQCCEHIPYNSSKKDFFVKTGRESIEVFKYNFQLPGEDLSYTVMWDYNVGLVRMTPFFKCLGYPKTKPSQMLDKNPGLRDISPSITGGAVAAQGYWMPYRCAKAICATFCYRIAGALIPLFGPFFPSECAPPTASNYKEMIIEPRIIMEATKEVEAFRDLQHDRVPIALGGTAVHESAENYTFRAKRGDDEFANNGQPPFPQRSWAPTNNVSSINCINSNRPVTISAPSTADRSRDINPWPRTNHDGTCDDQTFPKYVPAQHINPFLNSPSRMGLRSQTSLVEKFTPKRRRQIREGSEMAYSPVPSRMDTGCEEVNGEPVQDLDRLKAAAVLLSIQQETRKLDRCSTAIADSSDDDSSSKLHQKKRPKAHSF